MSLFNNIKANFLSICLIAYPYFKSDCVSSICSFLSNDQGHFGFSFNKSFVGEVKGKASN